MSDQTTEPASPDLAHQVARLTIENTGLRYWLRRNYCEGWRHNPAAGIHMVRRHMAEARRSEPPLPEKDVGDQRAILAAMSAEVDQVGEEIIESLSQLPPSMVPQIHPDGSLDVGALLQCIEHQARLVQALQWWLTQCYGLVSGGRFGRMSDLIRMKMDSAKNDEPMGPPDLPADKLEASWLEELPGILAVGESMASLLSTTQHNLDRRRAEAGSQ